MLDLLISCIFVCLRVVCVWFFACWFALFALVVWLLLPRLLLVILVIAFCFVVFYVFNLMVVLEFSWVLIGCLTLFCVCDLLLFVFLRFGWWVCVVVLIGLVNCCCVLVCDWLFRLFGLFNDLFDFVWI